MPDGGAKSIRGCRNDTTRLRPCRYQFRLVLHLDIPGT
jgi:hypothetical protein